MLLHSLGGDVSFWDAESLALSDAFRMSRLFLDAMLDVYGNRATPRQMFDLISAPGCSR